MAVVQLRNGIYVNSTETVPDADQTAAYKYASLFTKSRRENWEMSQRQAASEITDAKERDAASLKIYSQQLKDYNDRLLQLDKDIAGAGTDVAKANAATQRTALQEANARQKNAQDWAKAGAEQVSVSGGSKSSSKSGGSSTGSGGGGGGSSVKGLDKTGKDSGDAIRLAMSNAPSGTANRIGAVEDNLVQGTQELDMSTDATAMGNHATTVGQLVDERKSEYINAGYSFEDAKIVAEDEVLAEINDSAYKQYGTDYLRAQEIRDKETASGGASSSTRSSSSSSVRDPATLQPRYKDLGEQPDLVITTPSVTVDTKELEAKRKELADQLADLMKQGAPASTVDDFITRSREIMAGRFGSQQVSPNYYQRNAAQNIAGMSDADAQDLLTKFRSSAEGAPVRITPTTPIAPTTTTTLQDTDPLKGLVYDTSYGESGGGPGPEQLPGLKTIVPRITPNGSGDPLKGLVYDTSYGETGSGGGQRRVQLPGLQTSRRIPPPSGGDGGGVDTPLMSGPTSTGYTVTEGGSGGGPGPESLPGLQTSVPRLNNFPNLMDELRSLFPDGVPQEVLDAAANMQTSNPPAVSRPQMQNPGGTIGTVGPASGQRSDTTPNIGSKPEAIGDFSIPDMPGAYNDRPFDPVTNPYGGDFAPNKEYPPVPAEGGARFETTYESDGYVPMSDLERQQIIRLKEKAREENKRKQREIDDAKKAKPSGKTGYFQQRFDNAKEIVDQPGKLARLIASGPGKVAADVYNANKTTGKDFKLTYDTLTATYEDDKEALATAHQVALALDIASRNRTAPPKA